MRFGINVLLWSDTLCDELLPVLDEIKAIGYDIVELPAFEYDPKKYAAWGRRLDDVGPGTDRGDSLQPRGQSHQP